MDTKDMIPIPIREFISGLTVPVDLYVKLGDDKYVLIAKQGTKTQKDHLSSYKEKDVDYLWVEKAAYHKISNQTIQLAGIVLSKKDLDSGKKTQVVTAAAQTMFRHLDHLGLDEMAYTQAKQVADVPVQLVECHSRISQLMESLNQCSDDLLRHSMAVSAMSTVIGQAHNWQGKGTMEKLALGGLLHDIGKKTLPEELLKKARVHMSFEEIQLYETHPFKGMEMATGLGLIPDDIVAMIYQHHENSLGQGYPQRLRDLKTHPFARIVALADEFVNLTVANPNCPVPKTAHEAVDYIEIVMGQPFNKEAFRCLKRIVETEKRTTRSA
ncbi:MAG: HD domain-containing protein [Bdellovibrionales bacterium]|nr:HD domain-containing protein [Bdellovibrionales bacterium]